MEENTGNTDNNAEVKSTDCNNGNIEQQGNTEQQEKPQKRLKKRDFIILGILLLATILYSVFLIPFLIYATYCFYKRFGAGKTLGCCLGSMAIILVGVFIMFWMFLSSLTTVFNGGLVSSCDETTIDNGTYELMVGQIHYHGTENIKQSYPDALEWFHKSADKGNPRAMFYIGECYYNGYGVEQSYDKAAEWYTKSADKGYVAASAGLLACKASQIDQELVDAQARNVGEMAKEGERLAERVDSIIKTDEVLKMGQPVETEELIEQASKALEEPGSFLKTLW